MRDISLLHPEIADSCRKLIELCKENGIEIIITQTLRTKKEQEDIYAKGRTKPGRKVTNARYPYSPHCWGVAFDIAVKVNGKVNWNRIDLYKKVGALGKSIGLFWGGDFKSFVDYPHFEDPKYVVGKSVKTLIRNWKTPDAFIQHYRSAKKEEEKKMPEQWKLNIIKNAKKAGIITDDHNPDEPATKWFVLAVALNVLRILKGVK